MSPEENESVGNMGGPDHTAGGIMGEGAANRRPHGEMILDFLPTEAQAPRAESRRAQNWNRGKNTYTPHLADKSIRENMLLSN